MVIEHTPNDNGRIYVQARALEWFAGYTREGALYVLRERPDILDIAIRRTVREGIEGPEGIESYLKEMEA